MKKIISFFIFAFAVFNIAAFSVYADQNTPVELYLSKLITSGNDQLYYFDKDAVYFTKSNELKSYDVKTDNEVIIDKIAYMYKPLFAKIKEGLIYYKNESGALIEYNVNTKQKTTLAQAYTETILYENKIYYVDSQSTTTNQVKLMAVDLKTYAKTSVATVGKFTHIYDVYNGYAYLTWQGDNNIKRVQLSNGKASTLCAYNENINSFYRDGDIIYFADRDGIKKISTKNPKLYKVYGGAVASILGVKNNYVMYIYTDYVSTTPVLSPKGAYKYYVMFGNASVDGKKSATVKPSGIQSMVGRIGEEIFYLHNGSLYSLNLTRTAGVKSPSYNVIDYGTITI